MSSFAARFYFDGADPAGYEVRTCSYHFAQTTDDKGRPSSAVRGGYVCLTLWSTVTGNAAATHWMLDAYARKNGRVDFCRADQQSVEKQVSFTNAYCISLTESFRTGFGMKYMLMLSCETLTVLGATFGPVA